MAATWNEQLRTLLTKQHGAKQGQALFLKYSTVFPPSYTESYDPETAASDIEYMEPISAAKPLDIKFYATSDQANIPLHVRLFQWAKPVPLSDVLPMLENFDLRTDNDRPHMITLSDSSVMWISDFTVNYNKGSLALDAVKDLFQQAFINIYMGLAENDGFNKLILGASLHWREVMVLRTLAKFLRQTGFRFSQPYIEKALTNNAAITKQLISLFDTKHNPHNQTKETAIQLGKTEERILQALENVNSLDEDTIIRRMLDLIKASLRTNYYQAKEDGVHKDYLSIKFSSRTIPDMPVPIPLYEIFVYSPRFEGIHLRNTKVARGGIRWSDRHEDFRTEILGLMKAQVVKNSVIVPSGAKGGFVLKASSPQATREAIQKEVVACYTSFISGLLDLTDNIANKKYIPPKNVVCYDDTDAYLVVAADKGTAAFSDIANGISKEYGFWLRDAFASGGKTGYDHKKLGITARGAWESIKRHFRELNIDIKHSDITVVGIGDMSGDVFGNGMMYTNRIKLIAAFDHRHIFLDPNPDPAISYEERVRLFNTPGSSWEDYNPSLISPGGGVYARNLKTITLSPEMKDLLGIETTIAPNELIQAILRAPVDLLFNGGIGTYVKSSKESNAEVGDRANEYLRVNGNELRCKVVGEGGNLGFTQLGRIEYALIGGLINTDFIDNSAGVDCSDHEVNLKILLDNEVQKGKLTEEHRNDTLASVTDEVAELVLNDNYNQALLMSFSAYAAKKNLNLHTNYIKDLEAQGLINRRVENLPDHKELVERKAAGLGLTRPEIAVLLAYTKINVKQEILKTDLPEDPYLSRVLETAFPVSLRQKYGHAMSEHRLARDIIATQLSNKVINEMGITFIYRLQMETGATVEEIIRAHAIASHIFDTRELQKLIESLDFKIKMSDQYDMLYNLRNLINLATRWFLHGSHYKGNLQQIIEHYASRIKTLEKLIPDLMGGHTKEYLNALTNAFLQEGLNIDTARRIATYRAIYTTLNIIDVATNNKFDLIKTAKVYFAGGERVSLLWFRDQIATDAREGHWNTLARLTLRDELDIAQRLLTIAIIKTDEKEADSDKLIEKWVNRNQRLLARWDRQLTMLHSSTSIEYAMFFIAIRELLGLIMASHEIVVS